MRPIPVSFHVGPLLLHTYGFGLAVTFIFATWYLRRRLRDHGWATEWLTGVAAWTIAAALVGARIVHVVANWAPEYSDHLAQIPQVWHGGLSSFGGLALGVPTGFFLARRRCPELRGGVLADLVAPVLLAGWAVGRLLGPQLMVRGGGHVTNAWYGMYYAGEVGKRLPVPLFQAALTFVWLLVAWRVEARVERSGGPRGLVMAASVTLWGLGRWTEEHFWLAQPGQAGDTATALAGLAVAAIGLLATVLLLVRYRPGRPSGAEPAPSAATGDLVT